MFISFSAGKLILEKLMFKNLIWSLLTFTVYIFKAVCFKNVWGKNCWIWMNFKHNMHKEKKKKKTLEDAKLLALSNISIFCKVSDVCCKGIEEIVKSGWICKHNLPIDKKKKILEEAKFLALNNISIFCNVLMFAAKANF